MTLIYIAVFIFGCVIGSFLNSVLYRMEQGKSFIKGRSFCPKCKHSLVWYDLIPIFSFLFLLGKCRYCKKKIAVQYLIAEISTGILFLLVYIFIGLDISLIYFLIVACLLEMIFIYDLKHSIIPDKLVFSAIGISIVFLAVSFFYEKVPIKDHLFSALAASGFFFIIWAVSKGKWMGFGDVKLALFMGLFLGWPNILTALFFAFIAGAIIGLILIALQKKKIKSEVPFGPFLIAGTFFALFWGEKIFNWYLNLIY